MPMSMILIDRLDWSADELFFWIDAARRFLDSGFRPGEQPRNDAVERCLNIAANLGWLLLGDVARSALRK